jgi:hypothetical protein
MRTLKTYSLIKALYDEGKDYIDAFWPILLQVMPLSGQKLEPGPIADLIVERFGLAIPVLTVKTLADRARGTFGYLDRDHHAYSLTEKGQKYVVGLESSRGVQRRLEELVTHACEMLKTTDAAFADREFTLDAITRVVEQNYHMFDFVVERSAANRPGTTSDVERAVLEYCDQLESAYPVQFTTLRDLILGSTLAGLLKRDDINDATSHFRPTELYLDTNIVLSLLGLRFEVECRPAVELFGLLGRSTSFQLKVFDFTLDELTALLQGYRQAGQKYLPHVKVKALYSSLRYRGMTPADVTLLIAGLEDALLVRGVSVVSTTIVLDGPATEVDASKPSLASYKPDQDPRGQRHDLAAITEVARRRGRSVRKVERAGAFFLTEDNRLSNYAFVAGGHRDRGTISEVIPDRLLTNLLWLKQPDSLQSLPVSTVIAMHSRELFIDRRVWDAFHRELGRIVESGEIPDEAASILLYDGQVHQELATLGLDGRDAVNQAWLLERLRDAKARKETDNAAALEQHGRRLAGEHARQVTSIEAESDVRRGEAAALVGNLERELAESRRASEERQQRLLAFEKAGAQKIGDQVVVALKVLGCLIAVAAAYQILRHWAQIEAIFVVLTGIVSVAIWVFGWHSKPRAFWTRLRDWVADRILTRRLQNIEVAIGGPLLLVATGAQGAGGSVREG